MYVAKLAITESRFCGYIRGSSYKQSHKWWKLAITRSPEPSPVDIGASTFTEETIKGNISM